MVRRLIGLAAGLSAAVLASEAAAHPHVFIDTVVRLHLEDDGRVKAIEEIWMFDEFYSKAAIEDDVDANRDKRADGRELATYAAKAGGNLKKWHYFIEASRGGTPVALGPAAEQAAYVQDGRLALRFLVPLAEPLAVADADLSIRVFDPTYYIAMSFLEKKPLRIAPESAEGRCTARVAPAAGLGDAVPLSEAFFQAALQPPDGGIGAAFAETIHVTCR